MDYEKDCWDILELINKMCNKKTIKNLTTKISFDNKGNKTKWRDFQIIELIYKNEIENIDIYIKMEYVKYYVDILIKEEYKILKNKNIEIEDIQSFLKGRKRILMICDLLK